jgi:hypothetical protein
VTLNEATGARLDPRNASPDIAFINERQFSAGVLLILIRSVWLGGYSSTNSRGGRPMPAKTQETTAALFRRRSQGMDEAVKAGIAATANSVLILAIVLLVMYALPISVG